MSNIICSKNMISSLKLSGNRELFNDWFQCWLPVFFKFTLYIVLPGDSFCKKRPKRLLVWSVNPYLLQGLHNISLKDDISMVG